MDEISKPDFQPETPCIKVVGVGETVAPVIESLKDNWKGDIDAGMADECKPADTDIMAIVVSDGDAETTHKVIDAFHGILTIVVVTESAEIEGFDIPVHRSAITNMPDDINEILIPIIQTGWMAYDFHDFEWMVKGCTKFTVESAVASGESRIADCLSQLTPKLEKYSNYSIILYSNPKDEHPLAMTELASLTRWIGELPENIEIVWAVYRDDTLSDSNVKLTVIAAR